MSCSGGRRFGCMAVPSDVTAQWRTAERLLLLSSGHDLQLTLWPVWLEPCPMSADTGLTPFHSPHGANSAPQARFADTVVSVSTSSTGDAPGANFRSDSDASLVDPSDAKLGAFWSEQELSCLPKQLWLDDDPTDPGMVTPTPSRNGPSRRGSQLADPSIPFPYDDPLEDDSPSIEGKPWTKRPVAVLLAVFCPCVILLVQYFWCEIGDWGHTLWWYYGCKAIPVLIIYSIMLAVSFPAFFHVRVRPFHYVLGLVAFVPYALWVATVFWVVPAIPLVCVGFWAYAGIVLYGAASYPYTNRHYPPTRRKQSSELLRKATEWYVLQDYEIKRISFGTQYKRMVLCMLLLALQVALLSSRRFCVTRGKVSFSAFDAVDC